MRRSLLSRLSILAALAALILVFLPGRQGDSEPSTGRQTARVHAQTQAVAATGVDLTLHDNTLYWNTLASVRVVGQLRSADGNLRAQGAGQSNPDGDVQINFGGGGGGPGGGGPGGGGGGNNMIRPGDQITLIPTGGVTATMLVPQLMADVSAAGDRVFGSAPAGAMVEAVMPSAGQAITRTATAGGDGSFSIDYAGSADIRPGDAGELWIQSEDNTIRAELAAFVAIASVGSREISGEATPGDAVEASITGADGSDKGSDDTTVQNGGTDWDVGGFGGGGGPGGGGNDFGPVEVGDTVAITLTSPVDGASLMLTGVVPELEVEVDPDARTVSGSGPAGGMAMIEATSPEGDDHEATAAIGPDGRFEASLPDAEGIGPGWRIAATVGDGQGLRFRAFDAIEQVRVGVHAGYVTGVADAGRSFTVTVRAGDGTVKAVDGVTANNNALFNAFTGGGGGGPGGGGGGIGGGGGNVSFEVGDRVEVEFIEGDPVVITIPPVSAMTDQDGDTVSGEAPAGSRVRVSQGGGQNQVIVETTADAGGQYSASFDGQRDIQAPMGGDVDIRLLSGHELFTTWAAVQLTVEMGNSVVYGNGPQQRNVTATLIDSQGNITVGEAEDDVSGGGGGGPGGGGGGGGLNGSGFWSFSFEDSLGEPVIILPGDTVSVIVGDDEIDLLLPQLSGVAFVADDLVNGITTPNRALDLTIEHILVDGEAEVELVAGADGTFSHSFEGEFDIQHNDQILFHTMEDGHNVNSRLTVPGLRYDLDTALLQGSWRPNTPIEILYRGLTGGEYSAATVTAGDATFQVTLEQSGQRPLARAGDTITVQDPATRELVSLTIPELTVAGDTESDDIAGRATPGGLLQLRVNDAFNRSGFGGGPGGGGPGGGGGGGGFRLAEPEIGQDGNWTHNFDQPNYNVQPGSRMWLLYREPGGHLVERTRYVPIANVQHGGGTVCGFSEPRAAVSARFVGGGGSTLASANGTVGFDSSFDLEAQQAGGELFRSQAGQTARVDLAGETVEVELPQLSIDVTWGQAAIRGTGPANSIVRIRRPADVCLHPVFGGGGFNFGTQTNDEGEFENNFGAIGVDPGEGIEVAFFLENGHRIYRHVFRSLGQVFVETSRVQGRATPSSPVSVTVLDRTGNTRGSASTTATGDGYFLVELTDGSGDPLIIQATDVVRLDASGETPDIPMQVLRFDWSVGDIVTLQAAPDRFVLVTLAIEGRDPVNLPITVDGSGNWQFTAADIPPRQTWTLDDILGVRAVIETDNEHQIVAEAGDLGDTPIEPPTVGRGSSIFLPMAVKSERVR